MIWSLATGRERWVPTVPSVSVFRGLVQWAGYTGNKAFFSKNTKLQIGSAATLTITSILFYIRPSSPSRMTHYEAQRYAEPPNARFTQISPTRWA